MSPRVWTSYLICTVLMRRRLSLGGGAEGGLRCGALGLVHAVHRVTTTGSAPNSGLGGTAQASIVR
jgi:hypothetical protein